MKKSDNQHNDNSVLPENQSDANVEGTQQSSNGELMGEPTATEADKNTDTVAQLEEKLADANDKYIRLVAEFDNYRKRTLKEKMDILRNGGEEVIKGLLPVLDDFDRSVAAVAQATDVDAIREGLLLIQAKLLTFLKQQGLSEVEANGKELDTDLHDAVTTTPTANAAQKGKIVDVIQKGYALNDKVIRHAKVVVGE